MITMNQTSQQRKVNWGELAALGTSLLVGAILFLAGSTAARPARALTLAEETPTVTATVTIVSTATPTPTATQLPPSFLPIVFKPPPSPTPTPTPTAIPLTTVMYCNQTGAHSIPDDNDNGVSDTIAVSDPGIIVDFDVYLSISHTWVGDLKAKISHNESGRGQWLLDRPGVPASGNGCENDNVAAFFDDETSQSAENQCSSPAIGGVFQPSEALSAFRGEAAAGGWTLQVSDHYPADTGTLNNWCIEITYASELPSVESLPSQATIWGLQGQNQAYNLDCEIRSAVDWADYFGVGIGEDEFFDDLPQSDNPETGFVGNVNGTWGYTPPNDYGVHAPPIAETLRDYGLDNAKAVRGMSWDALRAEIAAGRPVIVWVIGSVWRGIPKIYTASDGQTTVTAAYEHTVIVVGYSESTVTILNGDDPYDTVSLSAFLDSWAALRQQAVIAAP